MDRPVELARKLGETCETLQDISVVLRDLTGGRHGPIATDLNTALLSVMDAYGVLILLLARVEAPAR